MLQRRKLSEYAPPPPSPSDLKSAMPEKFSVGKNLKLKGVLFEYDILAGSSSGTALPSKRQGATAAATKTTAAFQPLTQSGENLIDEVTGILGKARAAAGLGGGNLQDMGKALVADLKAKMGTGGELGPENTAAVHPQTNPRPAEKQSKQPTNAQDLDPRAKYSEKLRLKAGGQSMIDNAGKSPQPTGDASLLFAARERVSSSDGAIPSAWMLRQGAGDLLLYLAARSVRVGVIAGPSTTPAEFESFVQQLRQQSVVVGAAISPAAMNVEGMEASLAKAGDELSGGGGAGSEVLVVGSSDPILRAATAAKMFTARYHPPNSRRQGVIQTFVVRDIDEVRTVVEEVNGVSFR